MIRIYLSRRLGSAVFGSPLGVSVVLVAGHAAQSASGDELAATQRADLGSLKLSSFLLEARRSLL